MCNVQSWRRLHKAICMTKHFIIMSSAYTAGARIALDIVFEGKQDGKVLSDALHEIKQVCGAGVPLSTHFIQTDFESWDSVVAHDSFFEDVICTTSAAVFSEIVKQSRVLYGLDIVKYIHAKAQCDDYTLRKLAFLAYADYFGRQDGRLFEETSQLEGDSSVRSGGKVLPARSRILFARDGIEKIFSIDRTLEKYCVLGLPCPAAQS